MARRLLQLGEDYDLWMIKMIDGKADGISPLGDIRTIQTRFAALNMIEAYGMEREYQRLLRSLDKGKD